MYFTLRWVELDFDFDFDFDSPMSEWEQEGGLFVTSTIKLTFEDDFDIWEQSWYLGTKERLSCSLVYVRLKLGDPVDNTGEQVVRVRILENR